jgi:N-methylhydantoinase B
MNTYNPTVHAVINASFDALGQLTEMVQRADGSDSRSLIFGFPKKSGQARPSISYEIFAGGSGASSSNHGLTGCHVNQTNGRITPIEILETEYPLRITEFSVLKKSGGQGLFAGGDAFRRVYQSMEDGIRLSIRSSRHQIPPRGVSGGEDGRPGRAVLYPDGESQILSSREVNIPLECGESFALDTPSGGGCGDLSELSQGSSRVA